MTDPVLGEVLTATVEAGGRHVRLQIEYTRTGWYAQVFETDGDTTVCSEMKRSHNEAVQYAEEVARAYLADKDLKIPPVNWRKK